MIFWSAALQTTGFCSIYILPIAIFVTFIVTLIRQRQGVKPTIAKIVLYFLAILITCFVVVLIGVLLFLNIGVENTQSY